MIRLLVVEDHPVVTAGVVHDLSDTGDMEVVGDATDVPSAVAACASLRPDVVLCDVMLHGAPGGFDLPSELARAGSPRVPVLFYSSYEAPWFLVRAREVGAAGYVFKRAAMSELRAAIERVAAGGRGYPDDPAERPMTVRPPSPREAELVLLAARGLGNEEIADRLRVSPKTIEGRLGRLYARCGVTSRIELAMLAVGQGWITVNDAGRAESRQLPRGSNTRRTQ
jgi:DNA-binding NarL/FixJ family response regulator